MIPRKFLQARLGVATLLGWLALGGLLQPAIAPAGELYELQTGREAALLGAGLALGGAGLNLTHDQTPLSAAEVAACRRSQVNGLDRFATRRWSGSADTASDVLALTLGISPAVLYTQTGAGLDAGEFSLMWGETLLLQHATVGLLKGLFGRARPFVYNDDPRVPAALRQAPTARRSFPSGHTATAFAGAVFLSEVFARLNPDDPARHWVRGGSLALAATTGWLRVAAGRHFLSDVLAGAVLGSLIGWGVPRLHEVDPPRDGAAGAGGAPGLVLGFAF